MSHTNSTQFYNLPQFIGTDVPGWLTDVNQGYAAIDAGMRAAQVKADNADQTAGQAANDVQAVSQTVTTQAAQISAAAGAASAAQTTANGADAKADANANAITGLDTRVTALEQGGGGGASVKETLSITNNYYALIPEKVGYVPTRCVITATTSTLGAFSVVEKVDPSLGATHIAVCMAVVTTGQPVQHVADYTVVVFYDKL